MVVGESTCERNGRIITTGIVWLLLGAIVNVAVAWGIALFVPIYTAPPRRSPIDPMKELAARELPLHTREREFFATHWMVIRHHRFGTLRAVVTAVSRPFPNDLVFEDLLRDLPGFPAAIDAREAECERTGERIGTFVWDARGWPMRSVGCHWPWHLAWPNPPISGGVSFGTLKEPRSWPFGVLELRAFPYTPLWPGFAVNTLFYAAVLRLLFAAPFMLRRRRRIKRGLCPACAYPIGESEVCTECGAVVKAGAAHPYLGPLPRLPGDG